MLTTTYSTDGVLKWIAEKKQNLKAFRGDDQMVLIIQTTNASSFKNIVDIIDEANINLVKRYYLDEPTDVEISAIAAYNF